MVAQTEHLVALPSLGPLFPGHLLVLPKLHVETFASCVVDVIESLEEFVRALVLHLDRATPVAIFEHGAKASTGGSCGVYHAHIHIVPMPSAVPMDTVLPMASRRSNTLSEALRSLGNRDQYLLYGTLDGYCYVDDQELLSGVQSQYIRKQLADTAAPGTPWDWRLAEGVDASILRTMVHFRSPSTSSDVNSVLVSR